MVAYKVEGQVKEGRLTLRPAEADLHDNDELLQQSFFKTEPKGWGRHVVTMAWSSLAKWTGLMRGMVFYNGIGAHKRASFPNSTEQLLPLDLRLGRQAHAPHGRTGATLLAAEREPCAVCQRT